MNYLNFGIIRKNKKFLYEEIKGNLYDEYMLSRYFKDIFILENFKKKKAEELIDISKAIHHKKDLKFNLINYFLILSNSNLKFYEFGATILEKYFYFKIFDRILKKKISSKILYSGVEISKKFQFFIKFFHNKINHNISRKFKREFVKNSIFYSKGVSILYEPKNSKILKDIFKYSNAGFLDISICKNNKKVKLATGYKLHYLTKKNLLEILNQDKNKEYYLVNKSIIKDRIYLEILYGKKKILQNFFNLFFKFKNQLTKKYQKSIGIDMKFINTSEFF